MFYDPRENLRPAPLAFNPFNALVAPRPIGWISTMSANGEINLAPYSYFNGVSADPPMVMFAVSPRESSDTPKDTFRNILEVPEFVVNLVSNDLREAMNQTSKTFSFDINEMEQARLTPATCVNVSPPSVAESPAALECQVYQTVELPAGSGGRTGNIVIGRVVGIHINDEVIQDGKVDQYALQQIARLGYMDYSRVERIFEMRRPK